MINFNKIIWEQILTLFKTLQLSSSLNLETVERWYNAESLNFKETLEFLLELRVVTVTDNKIIPSTNLKKVIASNDESIRQFFVDTLFQKKSNIIKYFGEFFDNFELHGDLYRFIPSMKERLKYSGIRNFLISLGAISSITPSGSYVASGKISTYLLDRKKVLPYTQFKDQLKANDELGRKAELLVLEEERKKFNNYPDLLDRIRHVSLQDVNAGYDIESFETTLKKGRWQPKFIEVKAISKDSTGFYWSRNEINKSKQLGDEYYLYLLPVTSSSNLDVSGLQQIRNPYKAVFQNKDGWQQEVELVYFCKK